jgi:hypothetical protein
MNMRSSLYRLSVPILAALIYLHSSVQAQRAKPRTIKMEPLSATSFLTSNETVKTRPESLFIEVTSYCRSFTDKQLQTL